MKAVLAALLLLATSASAGAPGGAGAARIVSLNLCTDQYLMLLAPGRAVALSPLARDPALSVVAAQAARVAWVRPDAEAVLALRPDLVLAGPFGAQTTLAVLARHGVPILRTGLPQDFAAIRGETRRFAAALGASGAGERLIAGMDARLAAIAPHPRLEVLALEPRGYVPGEGSLEQNVILAAGFTPAPRFGRLGLEAIAAHPPALIVAAVAPDYPALATDLLRHPALAAIPRRTWRPADLACAGPWTAEAAAALAAP